MIPASAQRTVERSFGAAALADGRAAIAAGRVHLVKPPPWPVVARVGGLADTVKDADESAPAAGAGTGIQFAPVSRANLERAIGRAMTLRRDVALWRGLQSRAMATDVGWTRPARQYAALFRALVAHRAA